MLSLGLELPIKEQKIPTYNELLMHEIIFTEAYQAFVNYKNMCEIVVKAKASNEALAFANDLLNTSIKYISVSEEELKASFQNAWKKFLVLWEKFSRWARDVIIKILKNDVLQYAKIDSVPTLTLKELKRIENGCSDILIEFKTQIKDNAFFDSKKSARDISDATNRREQFKESRDELALKSRKQLTEWLNQADKTIKAVDNATKHIAQDFLGLFRRKTTDGKIMNKNIITAARYILRNGSMIIKNIQKTIIDILKKAKASGARIASKDRMQKFWDDLGGPFGKGF